LYTQEILGRFSQDENRAQELYADFVDQGMGEKRRKDFHHGSHLGQILGSDHFADLALKTSDAGITQPKSIEEILTVVCEAYGVELKLMYEPGNGRPCSELRAMAALIIQESEAITITSLAKELGRDLSALSKSAARLRTRMRKDESLQEKHKRISDAVKMSICPA